MMTAEQIKSLLHLTPLTEEGGFYAETYRSEEQIPQSALPGRYRAARSHGTAIYYLLTPDSFSSLHCLQSDEVYHFYLGDPIEMLQLWPDGTGQVVILGPDLLAGMQPQIVVPRGVWQGSRLLPGGEYALLGTTMAPGFDFADYKGGQREALIEAYPQYRDRIVALTRGAD